MTDGDKAPPEAGSAASPPNPLGPEQPRPAVASAPAAGGKGSELPPLEVPAEVAVHTLQNPIVVEANPAPAADAPFLQWAGVSLAKRVLCFMLVVTVILFVLIATGELHTPPEIAVLERLADATTRQYVATGNVETLRTAQELVLKLETTRKGLRDFWLSLAQLLLLNLLLPVLTSILGYVFGTSSRSEE